MGCDERTEDTITLLVDWESYENPSLKGTGVYTASYVVFLY
jgi:D-galacturonate reductase